MQLGNDVLMWQANLRAQQRIRDGIELSQLSGISDNVGMPSCGLDVFCSPQFQQATAAGSLSDSIAAAMEQVGSSSDPDATQVEALAAGRQQVSSSTQTRNITVATGSVNPMRTFVSSMLAAEALNGSFGALYSASSGTPQPSHRSGSSGVGAERSTLPLRQEDAFGSSSEGTLETSSAAK
jgi:hypothetical protein